MALVVTPGAATADSYLTLAEYRAHALSLNWTLAGSDALDEVHLRKAAETLDILFVWKGRPSYETQARAFPRTQVGLVNGYTVEDTTIPQAIKTAQARLAYEIRQGRDALSTSTGAVKRRKVGPIETEYLSGQTAPRMRAVAAMVRGFTMGGRGNPLLSRS